MPQEAPQLQPPWRLCPVITRAVKPSHEGSRSLEMSWRKQTKKSYREANQWPHPLSPCSQSKAPRSFCLPIVTYNGPSHPVKQESDSLLILRDHPVFGFPYENMWYLLREGHLFLKCDHNRVLAHACFPGY